jgi:NAD(P)-dependent dehydrogenase (short-subunit alcohol dehydrogenase family)
VAVPHLGAYAVAKTALTRFTENLAAELINFGVRVFAISPGTVRTAMTEHLLESEAGKKRLPWFRKLYERGPGVPAEKAAQLVVQLASGRADALSGRLIDVADDLAKLQVRLEEVKRDDLYMLRVPKLDSENRKQKLAIGGG